MAIIYPIYKVFNEVIFKDQIMYLQHKDCKRSKHAKYRKKYEFRTKLPKRLDTGNKIYVYEPKKNKGSGKIVGEFQVGRIFSCNYAFGAFPFIVDFCRNVLKNDEYADKFERAVKINMPNYKQGYIMKYALDDVSIDYIEQHNGEHPPLVLYISDPKRCAAIEESERVWKLCDEYLRLCGFYNDWGESCYNYAIEILNPVLYDTPKELTEFQKEDGSIVEKAPQSFVYVKEV
jgi:predicted transcriptional regulator